MWAVADDGHGNGIPETISMVDFLKSRGFPNIYLNTFADTRNASLVENAQVLKMWIDKTKNALTRARSILFPTVWALSLPAPIFRRWI
jgi:hypothetical protein